MPRLFALTNRGGTVLENRSSSTSDDESLSSTTVSSSTNPPTITTSTSNINFDTNPSSTILTANRSSTAESAINSSTTTSSRLRSIRSALDSWSERIHHGVHRWRWPSRERNLIAAFFTLLSLTVLSASLADEEWIYLEGGNCRLKHVGIPLFYGWGVFQKQYGSMIESTLGVANGGQQTVKRPVVHIMYSVGNEHYQDCVNQRTADIFHGLMGVLFVGVATTMASFFLDTIGVKQGFLAWLRRNSIFSIFSVIFCVIIIGLTYWISIEIEQLQKSTVANPDAVHVQFEDGFYLIIAGGAFAICALVANLVKSSMQIKRRYDDRLALLEHMEQNEAANTAAALEAMAASRENVLGYYRRRMMQGMASSSASGANGAAQVLQVPSQLPPESSRPIGSTGPPPPLQMILNVPPPPPYTP